MESIPISSIKAQPFMIKSGKRKAQWSNRDNMLLLTVSEVTCHADIDLWVDALPHPKFRPGHIEVRNPPARLDRLHFIVVGVGVAVESLALQNKGERDLAINL